MVNILITGASCTRNKGAAAMVIATVNYLREIIKYPNFTLISPFQDYVEQKRTIKYGIEVKSQISKPYSLLLKAIIFRLFHKFGFNFFLRDDLFEIYLRSDLVLDISGDNLTQSFHLPFKDRIKPQIKQLYWILLGIILGIPTVIFAQGIGPVNNLIPRTFLRLVLKMVRLVIVRDKLSFLYIKDFKLNNLHLGADSAFLLEPVSPKRRDYILNKEGINKKKKLVGISLSQNMAEYLGLSYNKYINLMVDLIDHIHSDIGAEVFFVPHIITPIEMKSDHNSNLFKDDLYISEIVVSKVKKKDKCVVIKNEYSPEELKAIIGVAEVFIGCRMHANIAALSMEVPTLAISYSHKYEGIMDMFKLGDFVINMKTDRLTIIQEKFDLLWDKRLDLKNMLEKNILDVKKTAKYNCQLVSELLN